MKSRVKNLMSEIITVLTQNNEPLWAGKFERLSDHIDSDYAEALVAIKKEFGGAGSFNDLVLHKDGQMLKAENRHMSELQDELYSLLKTELTKTGRQ